MTKIILLAIAFIMMVASVQYIKKGSGKMCSDIEYMYGDRFRVYRNRKDGTIRIYDTEFKTDVSVYNKRMTFSSRKDAEAFLLEYGDLFACLENEE